MVRARAVGIGWPPLLAACALAACDDGHGSPVDAGADAATTDSAAKFDVSSTALAIDFTVTGCKTLDADAGCTGPAPLLVTFVPITAGAIAEFFWSFGDDIHSTEITPTHAFALPGHYDIAVIAGGGTGAVSRTRPAFVHVTANPIGGGCDVGAQCVETLQCVCGSADKCAAAFARGICTIGCRDMMCPEPAVCVDLTLAGAGNADTPWRQPLCLSPCSADGDCAPGLRCRDLPGRFPTGRWIRACFAEIPAPIGAACRSSGGALDNQACVTGLCSGLGAFGMCSRICDQATCPPMSVCAAFSGGDALCLPACTGADSCTQDPLLACEGAGGTGKGAFTVAGAVAAARFCVPKSCQKNADCEPSGRCAIDGAAGRCVRK